MTIPTKIICDPVKRREYMYNLAGRQDGQQPICPLENIEDGTCKLPEKFVCDYVKRKEYMSNLAGRQDDQQPICPLENIEEGTCKLDGDPCRKKTCSIGKNIRE